MIKKTKTTQNNVKKISKKRAVLSNRVNSAAPLFYIVPLKIG
jgi:hypothetical protein